jgi:CubicO group peptidase (beta-lactamase class C family)
MSKKRRPRLTIRIFLIIVLAQATSRVMSAEPAPNKIASVIESLVSDGSVAGGQLAIGEGDAALSIRSFGVCSVQHKAAVTAKTRFCIGSCSKMFAAAVVLSLASEKHIDLDVAVDRWLTRFSRPRLASGAEAKRAPTLRELLSHRGGVYSQRSELTPRQSRWIRDFTLPLGEAVNGIAGEPLSSHPGQTYAYSGAGYCVLGQVCAVVAERSFDELLAVHVAQPMNMHRTSYFPALVDHNIAVGHTYQNGQLAVDRRTPHLLGRRHQLPLIGGSVYAPAQEVAEFARMLLNRGNWRGRQILSLSEWTAMTTIHAPRSGGGYGLGLSITEDPTTRDRKLLSHGGALYGSFSFMAVDLVTRRFGVVTFTGRRVNRIRDSLKRWVRSAEDDP